MNPKLNVRQGAGGSRLSGAGKPGYPLPDNLKNNLIPTDTNDAPQPVEEDLLAVAVPVVMKQAIDPTGLVDKTDSFDLVMKAVLSNIMGEGGGAVKGDRVAREDIEPTLDKFKKDVLSKISHKSAKPIGSTGKKASSGDLDIGLDTHLTLDQVAEIIRSLGLEHVVSKGIEVVSVKFPQTSKDGTENGKFAQIDLMLGDEGWTQFAYFAPDEKESKYNGLQAKGLFIAILDAVGGHKFNPAKGMFKKVDKGQEKVYFKDPTAVAKAISSNSKEEWTQQDLTQSFEAIWSKAKRSFDKQQLTAIKTAYEGMLKGMKQTRPAEMDEGINDPAHSDSQKGQLKATCFDLISFHYGKLMKRGVPVNKDIQKSLLGMGTQGCAFSLNNGKVLKVTSDHTEARACSVLKGINSKYISHVFDVFSFPDSDFFGIVLEKLNELSGGEKKQLKNAVTAVSLANTFDVFHFEGTQFANWQSFFEKTLEMERQFAAAGIPVKNIDPHIKTLKRFNIDKIMDELSSRRIDFADYTENNLMKRQDGTYVINDLGYSATADHTPITKLERKIVEAAPTPKDLPKGIEHLEDMKPDQFMAFLSKYRDLELKGGLEVSEKVDGSARVTFGIENGKIWTQSKNGQKKTQASQYGDKPMFKPLRMAHEALASEEQKLSHDWPKEVSFFVAEVLYTKIPNTIEYGPNVLMIHGVQKSDGSTASDEESQKLATGITKAVGQKLNDGNEEWKFEYKRIINPQDVMVDVKSEFDNLSQIYDHLKQLEPNKLKAATKGEYKSKLQSFKDIQLALKKKLIGQLRKQKSAYGPEGGGVEGIVFRDLETGDLTKLVDKDYFTKLNNFLWNYRKLLDAGNAVDGKWEFGIMQKFRNAIADNVVGTPAAKLQNFVQQLKKFGETLEIPETVKDGESKANYIISQYIKKNDLMKGDFISSFKKQLQEVKKDFEALKKDWESKKQGDVSTDLKDDEGNVIKSAKMDKLIKDRTDNAFNDMQSFFAGVDKGLEVASGLSNELTKKTAVLKLMLGQNRFDKLAGTQDDDMQQESEKIDEQLFMKEVELTGKRAQNRDMALAVIKKFADKLSAKGIKFTEQPTILGGGSKGTAFETTDGRVLKITSDGSEAKACIKLIGKDFKNVYRVFDVFKFPLNGAIVLFGILQEKLSPLSTDKNKLNNIIRDSDLRALVWEGATDWSWIEETMLRVSRDENIEKKIQVLKDFSIPEMITQLGIAGITFTDWHADNIMQRQNGEYVVIDLGYSQVKGQAPVPVLEKKVTEEVADEGMYNDILKSNSSGLAKRGVKIGTKLGEGANGIAFDIGSGKVLKITVDEDEAKASNLLVGKKLQRVANIFDVFQFKTSEDQGDFFGIVLEKCSPLSPEELKQVDEDINTLDEIATVAWSGEGWRQNLKNAGLRIADKKTMSQFLAASKRLKEQGIFEVIDELLKNKIDWLDISAQNLMKRGDKIVAIDLGLSDSPGEKPSHIGESTAQNSSVSLSENKIDKIGVTIGRFQPFTRGHSGLVRSLTKRFDKVILLVAGNNQAEKENPFSFELREKIIKASLSDVYSKLEVYKVSSGFIPEVLSKIAIDEKSALQGDTAVTLIVGKDRVENFKTQLAKQAEKEKTGVGEKFFDPSLVVVEELPEIKVDGEDERISGTRFRKAVSEDDKETVKKFVDPLLLSNEADFEQLYADMKDELSKSSSFKPAEKKPKKVRNHVKDNKLESHINTIISDVLNEAVKPVKVVESIVQDVLNELGGFTGMGSSMLNGKGGTSAVSSFQNKPDVDSEELWQNQLSRLQLHNPPPDEVTNEEAENTGLDLGDTTSYKYEPIKDDVWIKWSPDTDMIPFEADKKKKGDAGGGEQKMIAEFELRGITATAATKRYDLDVDGKKYEVKELSSIRIQASGQPASKALLKYFTSYVKSLSDFLKDVKSEESKKQIEDLGLSLEALTKFTEAATSSLDSNDIPLGLYGATEAKNEKWGSSFLEVSEKIGAFLSLQKRTNKKLKISTGDGENSVDLLNGDVDESDLEYLLKIISKITGKDSGMQNVVLSHMLESNFKSNGIERNQIGKSFIEKAWEAAFDPKNILNHVHKLVIVDEKRGFLVCDPLKISEYFRISGITRGVQQFLPKNELLSKPQTVAKKVKKKDEKMPSIQTSIFASETDIASFNKKLVDYVAKIDKRIKKAEDDIAKKKADADKAKAKQELAAAKAEKKALEIEARKKQKELEAAAKKQNTQKIKDAASQKGTTFNPA